MVSAPDPTVPDLARPTALAAFLRGVERRAAVLAELQAGDPTLGDAALTRAMAGFREAAINAPMADWPRLFWRSLLEQPALRRATRARPAAFMPACTPALRAALLLRLAAGLDEAAAAAVLGVAPGSLRQAVLRTLPTTTAGTPDAATWVRLQSDIQRRIRELPTARSLRLTRMREAALAGPVDGFFAPRPRWTGHWRAAVSAVVVAGMVALASTWWIGATGDPAIRVTPLGPAGAPASRYSATTALITHPDFELLADPGSERIARDAAFLAWTLGRGSVPAPPSIKDDRSPSVPETGEATDAP